MTTLPTNSTILYPPPPANNQRRPFLTPIPNLPGEFLLVLDNTSTDHIKRCHKNAQIYLLLGREGRGNQAALSYGGAIHAGLEVFHKEQYLKACYPDFMDLMPSDWAAVSNSAQDQAVLSHFASNPCLPDWRNPTVALEVLAHYRRRSNPELYPDYNWDILSDDRGPIIERAFEIPMGVCEIDLPVSFLKDIPSEITWDGVTFPAKIHLAWSGRIDLITQWQSSVYYTDHKTSSIGPEEFLLGCQFASQFIGYVWAGKQMVKLGILPQACDTNKFCVNRIQLSRPSKTTPNAGLLDRGPRGGEPRLHFSRHYFEYSDERISRWVTDTQLLIEDFLHSVSRNHFPLNDRTCFDKFGKCCYWDACSIDSELIGDKFLQSDAYKEVTWNPTT